MLVYIALILMVISILGFCIETYYEIRGGEYGREIDKAIKDMEKGITTVITDEQNDAFSVKKYKDGKKL